MSQKRAPIRNESDGRNGRGYTLALARSRLPLQGNVDDVIWEARRREVEKGRASARAGRLLDHDEVASRIERRYRG